MSLRVYYSCRWRTLTFEVLANEIDEQICQFDYIIMAGVDSLNYNLDMRSNWSPIYCSSIGDVNLDFDINILDIVVMVNLIVSVSDLSGYQEWATDMNIDYQLNVLDVILLVNIILDF